MPFLGELSALLTAALWTGSAIVFAEATRRAGSVLVNISRLILAAFLLSLLLVLFHLPIQLNLAQLFFLGASGVVGLTLGDTFLFKAFQEIGARVAMLIMSVSPAMAALLAYLFLGEGLTARGILGIAITLCGVAMVVLEREGDTMSLRGLGAPGFLYGILGAVGQAVGLILAKQAFMEGEINSFVATFVRIVASLVFLLPLGMMSGRFREPVKVFLRDRTAFAFTVTGSVLGPFLGISFSLLAVQHTSVGVAATIMSIVPILMLPMVWFLYKEVLSWKAITGAFIAVGGVGVLFLR